VLRRASLVSCGLRRLRVGPGQRVVVLVCDSHDEDRAVALRAIAEGGNQAVELDVSSTLGELTAQLTELRAAILFACAEGVERWRATRVPMRVIGDGLETIWWRAFELRELAMSPRALRSPRHANPESADSRARQAGDRVAPLSVPALTEGPAPALAG
jgi:hypothetical protein